MPRTAIVTRVDADETLELPIIPTGTLPRTCFTLRVISGPDMGSVLVLDPSTPPHAVLGQASSCAIPFTDPHISRKHIALTATATHVLLVDLGSTNGTRVNGVLVREARLYGGETVALGRTILGVETDEIKAANLPGTLPPPPDTYPPPPHPSSGTMTTTSPTVAERAMLAAQTADDYLATVLSEQLAFPDARSRVVAEFERRYVEDLLAKHNGNVTHAARASGIAHRYFQLVRARSR